MGCMSDNLKTNDLKDSSIPDNILSISKSIVKIKFQNKMNLGFLIKFFKGDNDFFCLITPGEVISQEMIEHKEEIKLFYDNEEKIKTIHLNPQERFIKNFKDIGIDSTVVEILTQDEIEKIFFLSPVINYIDDFKELKNEDIIIIQFSKGSMGYSIGKIIEINKYEFTHSTNIENSQGSPIFLKGNIKVIGIQKNSENKADFIGPIFNYFQNLKESKANNITNANTTNANNTANDNTVFYILVRHAIFDNFFDWRTNTNKNTKANYSKRTKEENGIIRFESGNYYKGEEKDGIRHGKGILYYKNGNIFYEGDWVDDSPEGNGKLIEENGNYYIGQFKKGLRHGKGKMYNKNGELTYEGDYVNDIEEGYGKKIIPSGSYYIGQFKQGKRNGKGAMYKKNGELTYEGEFVDNAAEGHGKIIHDDGSYYIGQFKEGKRHGKGAFYLKNGNPIYEGDYVNHLPEGNGKYYEEDGSYIIGQFKKGAINGKAVKYHKDGRVIYDGDYVNNQPEGNGKYIYETGDYFVGQLKNGMRHGKGKCFTKNGKLVYDGDFADDEMEGNGTLYYDDGSYYVGPFKKGQRDGNGKEYDKNGKLLRLIEYENGVPSSSAQIVDS